MGADSPSSRKCGVGVWGPNTGVIWTDRAAAGTKARVKGEIFQVEIAWWITQGLDRTIKHSALGRRPDKTGGMWRDGVQQGWGRGSACLTRDLLEGQGF